MTCHYWFSHRWPSSEGEGGIKTTAKLNRFSSGLTMIAVADSVKFTVPPRYKLIKDGPNPHCLVLNLKGKESRINSFYGPSWGVHWGVSVHWSWHTPQNVKISTGLKAISGQIRRTCSPVLHVEQWRPTVYLPPISVFLFLRAAFQIYCGVK